MPWWTDRRESCHPPSLKLTFSPLKMDLLSQWLTGFKLLGIPYLVGKISRSNFFFQGPGRLSEWMVGIRLFPFGMAYFPGAFAVSFRKCTPQPIPPFPGDFWKWTFPRFFIKEKASRGSIETFEFLPSPKKQHTETHLNWSQIQMVVRGLWNLVALLGREILREKSTEPAGWVGSCRFDLFKLKSMGEVEPVNVKKILHIL